VDETTEPDETTTAAADAPPDEVDETEVVDEPAEAEPARTVSRTTLIVSVLAALVIAGIAGVIIGWKVEQQRVKDDLANIRPIGRVAAIGDDTVTVTLLTASGNRTYNVTDDTVIDGESGGDLANLPEGSTVLVKSRREGGELEAVEIVVFPEGTTFAPSSS
jgi:hypothetical protein